MRGNGTVYRRGRYWWIQYWHNGEKRLESTRTANKTEAGKILRAKLEALDSGKALLEDRRFTVGEAIDAYLTHLGLRRGPHAASRAEVHARPLKKDLENERVVNLTSERIDKYISDRLARPRSRGDAARQLSNSKVNRETALLRASLRLAHKRGKLGRVPAITVLSEPPPRQGFWSSFDEFERFLAHIEDDDLRDVAWAGYLLGWRRSEVFHLRWEWVDMAATPNPEVRIPRTKNDEPRVIPLVDQLRDLFERRWERRKVIRGDASTFLTDLVFHREGEPLGDPRKVWDAAFNAAGIARRTWHDFRRTACRNMINAGVPEKVAMEITGHKTASIFRRYHIVAQADKAEALRKTFAFVRSEKGRSNVLPLQRHRSGKKRGA